MKTNLFDAYEHPYLCAIIFSWGLHGDIDEDAIVLIKYATIILIFGIIIGFLK